MRSDPDLKNYSKNVHAIYYKITGKSPVDFDEFDIITDVEKMIKFYWEWRTTNMRNNFNFDMYCTTYSSEEATL